MKGYKLGKKAASEIMLVLLTMGMLSLAFNIQSVKSELTTIIVPDNYPTIQGAINAASPGDTIYVRSGIYYENVVVNKTVWLIGENRRNTVIDATGKGTVVNLEANSVVIKEFTIRNSGWGCRGIVGFDSQNVTIQNNNVINNYDGICLGRSHNSTIVGNNVTNNTEHGLSLYELSNNTIAENNITNNKYGIHLYVCSNTMLRNNHMSANQYNLYVWGFELPYLIHDIDSSNTVDDKPVYYWINQQNRIVPFDAGYVALVNSTNIKAQNLNLKNNFQGLLLAYTKDSLIKSNNITNNVYGIYVVGSFNNTIAQNDITSNSYGIYLDGSSNNTIAENNITNNKYGISLLKYSSNNSIIGNDINNNDRGIYLQESSNNTVSGNNVINNVLSGICLHWSYNSNVSGNNITDNPRQGIALDRSHNNSVSENTITNNSYVGNYSGIYLYGSFNNTISGNIIMANHYGIDLTRSSNNIIYHNDFIDNTQHAHIGASGYANFWDDGYPSGGNYWTDFTGEDLYNGPYQNETGSDGIGDTPYIINEENVDRYPLMGLFSSFNTSVGYFVDVISNSTVQDFKYFDSNSTIIMHASNMTANQAFGFCKLTIPHDVMSPPYTVKVNGTTIEYQTIYENHTEGISIIYFAYEHSKLEITIIPEFPITITILLLMLIVISIIVPVKRKVLRRKFPT